VANALRKTHLPLKLALVKDLDCDDARVLDGAVKGVSDRGRHGTFDLDDSHVKVFIPVRVERSLDDRGCVDLLSVDANNSKRVRETQNIALDKRVGRDDCSVEQ